MDHLDKALHDAERRQVNIVAEEKKKLAPTRAAAEKALRESKTLVDKYRPVFLAKQVKMERVRHVLGAVPLGLKTHLEEALGGPEGRPGVLQSVPATFENIIRQIDQLTEWEVTQRVHLRIPDQLKAVMSNLRVFERLDRLTDQDFKNLEPALEKAAASGP